MPRIRKNVVRKDFSALERDEFQAVGYSDVEIDGLQEALKAPSWDFWSKVSELYLSLAAGSTTVLQSGKAREIDTVQSAKFTANYFSTANREIAKLMFMSDPYRDKRIRLVLDHVEDESQATYKEFKTKILSSKQNIERLKNDLVAMGA